MANPTGLVRGISAEELVEAWKRNGYAIKPTARDLGCDHANVRRRLIKLAKRGEIDADKLFPSQEMFTEAHPLAHIQDARAELALRSKRKIAKGDWQTKTPINIGDGPFILGLFGDPHFDNPGADVQLFEDELTRGNPKERIFTACVGDMFDNWPRAMGHLYQETSDPTPAWLLFEHLMQNHPFTFAVSGNHDEFSTGTINPLQFAMRSWGIPYRRSGGRFVFDNGITVDMRHIWQGNSQYSEAHNVKRAAVFGHSDADLIVGGHFHKGENRTHVRPFDGRVQKLVSLSSFKTLDNYANDRGFMSAEVPPVVWAVCDPRQPTDSHERVQTFYDFGTARAVLEFSRTRNSAGAD